MNISEMTNEQLNEALAIEVMGWKKHPDMMGSWWIMDEDKFAGYIWKPHPPFAFDIWKPAEDMNQAVECLNYWLNVTGSLVEIKKMDNKYWEVELWRESPKTAPENPLNGVATDESFPRALSEAVLMAKRGEK